MTMTTPLIEPTFRVEPRTIDVTTAPSVGRERAVERGMEGREAEASNAAQVPERVLAERLAFEAQRGSLDAFNRLVQLYERPIYNLALRILGQAEQAEDVTQETFLRAYQSLHQFHGGIFRAWLARIATNRCYDELRRRRGAAGSYEALGFEPRVTWSNAPARDEPQARVERLELSRALEEALACLPDDQRVAVVLSDVQGYDYGEIAALLGVPLGTVRSRLSRGRGRLRRALREERHAAAGSRVDPHGDAPLADEGGHEVGEGR
ncbi:MAG: sigma-70 family RNA polymerase sigma factor [Chloroflexota bacterium]|nr:sigma-70 family RNA polymerase sigma factor [Chloroflexota bacterium]